LAPDSYTRHLRGFEIPEFPEQPAFIDASELLFNSLPAHIYPIHVFGFSPFSHTGRSKTSALILLKSMSDNAMDQKILLMNLNDCDGGFCVKKIQVQDIGIRKMTGPRTE